MKFNNKLLGLIFGALVLILVYKKFFSTAETRSFKDVLIELDTSQIDRIQLINKTEVSELLRTNTGWQVKHPNGKTYPATKTSVRPLLEAANGIEIKQLVSRSAEHHADYELDDSSSRKLEFYKGNKMIGSIHVGRFDFDQARRTAKTYIRENGDDDVYMFEGFLAMSLDRKANDFRDKRLLPGINTSSLNTIQLNDGGQQHVIEKSIDSDWLDSDGASIDSVQISRYISTLNSARGVDFIDPESVDGESIAQIKFEGDEEHTIEIFKNSDGNFIISNELRPDQSFVSDSSALFKTVYLDLKSMLNEG